MWASVQSAITSANDNPIGAGNAILDSALGPSFDYLQTISSPSDLNVGDQGTMDQVGRNAGAISTYVGNLIEGPKSGNQFFKDTGGYCKAPGGKIVNRYTYTNNKLGMDDASAVLGPSFENAVAGSGFDGLIPAMGGDIASLNPLKLMNGLVLDAIPACKAYTCPITDIASGVDQGFDTKFLTPQLEFNIKPCKLASSQASFEAAAPAQESYANFQENLYQAPVKIDYVDPLSYITLGAAVVVFLGYVLMK